MAYFTCDENAKLVGAITSTCGADGKWTHPVPSCFANCDIPYVLNGQIPGRDHGSFLLHNDVIEVRCSPNFEPFPPDKHPRCHNGTLTFEPKCIEKPCKEWPPAIRNAVTIFTKLDHGARATYKCASGHRLTGLHKVIKCNYGNWDTSSLPKCEELYCSNALVHYNQFPNGKIMLEGQMGIYEFTPHIPKISEGRRIVFECIKGYVLRGPNRATCVDGVWQPQEVRPRCVPKEYPEIEGSIIWEPDPKPVSRKLRQLKTTNSHHGRQGSLPQSDVATLAQAEQGPNCQPLSYLEHAWVYRVIDSSHVGLLSAGLATYGEGTIVHYKCVDHPVLPAGAFQCKQGDWKRIRKHCAQTLAASEYCEEPILPEGVSMMYRTTVGQYAVGLTITVLCEATNQFSEIKCANSGWQGLERINCEASGQSCQIPEGKNVSVFNLRTSTPAKDGGSVGAGSRIAIRCKDVSSYLLFGPRQLLCEDGTWNAYFPSCSRIEISEEKQKGALPVFQSSERHVITHDLYGATMVRPGTHVFLDCVYPVGLAKLKPHWKATSHYRQYPTVDTSISRETLAKHRYFPNMKTRALRLSIYYASPEDSGQYMCTSPAGQAHSVLLKVTNDHCEKPEGSPPMKEGKRTYQIGETIIPSCPTGQTMSLPNVKLVCLEGGHWSAVWPSCEAVTCPMLPSTNHGLRINSTSNHFGAPVLFSCDQGKRLDGPRMIHCLQTGQWSDPLPTCRPSVCPRPHLSAGVEISGNSRQTYEAGEFATFVCSNGEVPRGNNTARCTRLGTWTSLPPVC